MNLESKTVLRKMTDFAFKGLVLCLLFLSFENCVEEPLPPNIPVGAKFEKKLNTFVFKEPGRVRVYYDNGRIYQDCFMNESGKPHGSCKFYSKYSDLVLSYGKLDNGVRRGQWIWNFEDGSLYIRQSFGNGPHKPEVAINGAEGNEEGSYERFYQNGQLELKGTYSAGYRNNLWQKYFPDGELEYSGYYKNGTKVRTWFYYFPNHKTEAIEVFDENGGLISRTIYLPDGTKNCEVVKGAEPVCQSLSLSPSKK
ncbi:toxin-antitoxin system YwqK family antitoxin [Leptospira sp. WS92.C1]